ncbi:WD repeat protein [Paecilomyces variotii No. 5]|uniref:WD repeat protein n=1 Tax=Byssochlamys spectabilis (strain No. 5 / NBRC 109023) TaxID=1356009 RepID=V5G2A2_BYSSN|nr:WD repeat protein [Paecilomyces variotii No. 5]
MSLSLEHIDACLPVSAVRVCSLQGSNVVIYGQGPYARIVNEATGVILAETRTFKRNNVHGFVITEHKLQNGGANEVQILAWGGHSVRIIKLIYLKTDAGVQDLRLSVSSPEYAAPDWILDACASHGDDSRNRAYLVTAHNALLHLGISSDTVIHLQQLASGVKTMLYSADILALSATHILIASGTVFGEVIVWSYFLGEDGNFLTDNCTSIHHFFTGHQGSIFGVDISPELAVVRNGKPGRLLASCSDDRTVRIWDISDCSKASRHDPSAYSTDGFELRSTGFGSHAETSSLGSEDCVAKCFGHAARIWGINFLHTSTEPTVSLVSRGEDAACQLWNLKWDNHLSSEPKFHLENLSTLYHHTGKHIWALDILRTPTSTVIYTGGADGGLKAIELGPINSKVLSAKASLKDEKTLVRTDERIKAFEFVADDCFITVTARGQIRTGRFHPGPNSLWEQDDRISWENISTEPDLASFAFIASLPHRGLAVIGNANGLMRLYNHRSKTISVVTETGRRPMDLYILDHQTEGSSSDGHADSFSILATRATSDHADLIVVKSVTTSSPQIDTFELALPSTFKVTSSTYLCGRRYITFGSLLGGLAVYDMSAHSGAPLEPSICIRRVHGFDVVTSQTHVLSRVEADGTLVDYFITCGRDSFYCLHELKASAEPGGVVRLKTIHRSSPSLKQTVEGAYFEEKTGDLMLYGFRSKDFVIWNETTRSELLTIGCGGVHRSWAYCNIRALPGCATFLWNQAKNLYAVRMTAPLQRTLRVGNHGREIKCMQATNSSEPLFATGGEDTTVRIFKPTPSAAKRPQGAFESLRVLNPHNTGLQQVTWSSDGRFLFTSAGQEELFVWRARSIPVFGLAIIQEASCPKDDPQSDLRITSFDVLDVTGDNAEDRFLFCLIFYYTSSDAGSQFKLLAKGTYMTNCLTQAQFLVARSSISLITSATDGHFAIWDLGHILGPLFSVESTKIIPRPSVLSDSLEVADLSSYTRYQIHLNSIKSIEYVELLDSTKLIIAGGDDNALSISLIKLRTSNVAKDAEVTTVSIPDAHAASVTAIKVFPRQKETLKSTGSKWSFLTATSGNDHRIKIWWITIDLEKKGTDVIDIVEKLNRYSPVADISSMDITCTAAQADANVHSLSGTDLKLLVCGVGTEMLDVQIS